MSSKRLRQITVKGFKSIRELESFEVQPLNILIGGNGAGKSNFIQVFELLRAIKENELGIYSGQHSADRLLYYGEKHTDAIKIQLELEVGSNRENGYIISLVPTLDGNLIFEEEIVYYHDKENYDKPYDERLGTGHSETRLEKVSSRIANKHIFRTLSKWKIYHFHDTSNTSPLKSLHDFYNNHQLATDGANLAAFLYALKTDHASAYQQIEQVVRLAAPFFRTFSFNIQETDKGKSIRLEWRDKSAYDTTFTAHDLSDGTIRFIALATLLLQPDETLPSVILIDEPELGLHPYAITLLAELFDLASKRAQVIVSTQSVPLVNQFSPENIVVVDRRDKQSTFERLDPAELEHWLDDYGVGDLWEKHIVGGQPQPEF